MSEIALNTTVPDQAARPYGFGSSYAANVSFAANTAVAYQYLIAPSAGVLKAVYTQAAVTSDATKTYTIAVANISNSSAAMIGTTLYDADPVLTAGTVAAAVLSSTAANLAVDKGDLIRVAMTGGTGSGAAAVQCVFETV